MAGARGVAGIAGGTLGRRVRGGDLSVLSLQASEIVGGGDSVSIDSDHTELPLSALGWKVGESNTSAPDVGHGGGEQGGDFGPETGRGGDTPVLAEVGSNVVTRKIAVLAGIRTRRGITTPLTMRALAEILRKDELDTH